MGQRLARAFTNAVK